MVPLSWQVRGFFLLLTVPPKAASGRRVDPLRAASLPKDEVRPVLYYMFDPATCDPLELPAPSGDVTTRSRACMIGQGRLLIRSRPRRASRMGRGRNYSGWPVFLCRSTSCGCRKFLFR